MSTGLSGRLSLITGAAGGIGAAVARDLGSAGARLLLVDKSLAALQALGESVGAQGVDAHLRSLDVTSEGAVGELVEAAEAELGPIDCLVHCAGVLYPAPALEATPRQWDDTFAVNARGPFLLTQQVALRMRVRRRGAIVAVSSNAASVPRTSMAVYAASKAALTAAMRCVGLELAPHGVRCNIVSPGSTDTTMLSSLGASHEQVISGNPSDFKLGVPLGRIAEPLDVARAVRFLLSDEARHITLHDLRIDGGATLDA